jgi:gamma-glutamyltranspeptidase
MVRDDGVLDDVGEYGGKYAVRFSPEDHGTSHVSVVDARSMAVSLTTTINTSFGSKVVSKSTGILLNNQMDDFSSPGQSNVYGLYPSEANFIAPGKKPLSSMSPMVVVGPDGRLRMVLGASGGSRITTAVYQTLLRIVAYGEGGLEAVHGEASNSTVVSKLVRSHAMPLTRRLPALARLLVFQGPAGTRSSCPRRCRRYVLIRPLRSRPTLTRAARSRSFALSLGRQESWGEFQFSKSDAAALEARGHELVPTDWGAVVQAVLVGADGRVEAISDARKDGAPAGYGRR